MKLGKETGSITNWLMSGTKGAPKPEVGMGCTFLHWTDRSPGTVIAIEHDRGALLLTAQSDEAKRIDNNGMSECQDYEFTRNPKGTVSYFRQNKNGSFEQVTKNPETGRWVKANGCTLRVGDRDKYHDFSF